MRTACFLLLAASILAACADRASTAALAPFVGTYSLRTLGGQPLPITCLPINCPAYSQVAPLGLRIDVLGSELSVVDGGTWSERLMLSVVTVTGTFVQPQTIHGTYERTGAGVHLAATSTSEYMDCVIIGDALTCGDSRARYTR